MSDLVIKVKNAIKKIEKEKNELFELKSLVAKDLSDIRWDLVLSAQWFDPNNPIDDMEYLVNEIMAEFDTDCLTEFCGIVPYSIADTNPLIEIIKKTQIDHNRGRFKHNFTNDADFIGPFHHELVEFIIPLNDESE